MLKTVEDLQLKLTDLQDFYRQRNVNMMAWRNMYFMRPESIFTDSKGVYRSAEPDEQRIVLPICYNLVESFRELLLAKAPSISVPQPSGEGQALVNADRNEKILLSIWEQAQIYERLRDAMWHGLVDGWGVLQLVWNTENKECPIEVLHHDPYNVYALPNAAGTGWKYVIHSYPRLVGSIREEWPLVADTRTRLYKTAKSTLNTMDLDGLKDTDSVTYFDYWDDEVNAVGISYTLVDPKNTNEERTVTAWLKEPIQHKYGFIPWYIILPCRLPFKNVGERMGVSIIYPIAEIAKYKDVLLSQKATMTARYHDPPLVTITEMGEDFEPVRTEAGMHLRLKTGEDAKYLVHPGPPQALDVLGQQIDEYIETSGLPKVLQGLYTGAASGVAMSLLRNPTLMRVAFKQKEVERTLETLNSDVLRLLEKKLTKSLNLWGVGKNHKEFDIEFTGDDIAGYYRNSVKLSASLPSDDAGTVNMILSLQQGKIISQRASRDLAQQTLHELVPQSLIDEEKQILVEQALQDPGLIQSLAAELAKQNNLVYLQGKPQNPQGGYGDKEITMPAGTLASQTPGTPGGNTQPSMQQRMQELTQATGIQQQAGISNEEIPSRVSSGAVAGGSTTTK